MENSKLVVAGHRVVGGGQDCGVIEQLFILTVVVA